MSVPPQLDAGAARESADRLANLADTLAIKAVEDPSHRMTWLQEAELAALIACHMRTYASLVEGDDFTEPRGTRP